MNRIAPPLIVHVFPSFAVGGAQIRFAAIANHFGTAFRHIVVAMDGNLACRERLASGLDVTFPEIRFRGRTLLSRLRTFRQLLCRWRPDLLVTSNWGTIEWAFANVPRVAPHLHMEDGFGVEERDRQLARRVWARRVLLRRSAILVPSRTLLHAARDVWRLPEPNIHYVPNGVKIGADELDSTAVRWPSGLPTIGTVAMLRAEKNIARLLRAFRLLDVEAHLVIVGTGPEQPALEKLSRQLRLDERVRFTGHIADARRLYPCFDLFVLTSDTEQMPLSLLEAMAAGLPVVSTDVGDVRTMLAGENKPFVVRHSRNGLTDVELAGCMQRLIQDPALRRRIGAANRLRAEREYSLDTMFEAHRRLWMER